MIEKILMLIPFLLVFGYISYQEIRSRSVQNYLILLLGVIALINVVTISISPLNVLAFAAIVAIMLGLARFAGSFSTADWLCVTAIFTFLTPLGIHISIGVLLLGFVSVVLHHLVVCVGSNIMNKTTFPGVSGNKFIRAAAFIGCKQRGRFDRFAFPAISEVDGVQTFSLGSSINGKQLDRSGKCPYVLPAIPILAHMFGISLIMIFILFPDSVL